MKITAIVIKLNGNPIDAGTIKLPFIWRNPLNIWIIPVKYIQNTNPCKPDYKATETPSNPDVNSLTIGSIKINPNIIMIVDKVVRLVRLLVNPVFFITIFLYTAINRYN